MTDMIKFLCHTLSSAKIGKVLLLFTDFYFLSVHCDILLFLRENAV